MRRDDLYPLDIVRAADDIASFLKGVGRDGFLGNAVLQSAVLQKLIVIGEAAARLSESTKLLHTEVEWRDIVAFRNIAVHAYFSVEWETVWVTATEDVLELKRQAARVLEQDYPGSLDAGGFPGNGAAGETS